MTSALSAISGQFSKSLVLGTFLPMVIFVVFNLIFVVPFLPADWPLLNPLKTLDSQWQVIAISLLTIVLSGILYNLNMPIIRLYEGYPWKESWIGKRCVDHYKGRFYYYNARWMGMRTLLRAQHDSEIENRWTNIGEVLKSRFPSRDVYILPTELGNVIACFESYPNDQYGMDAVALFPRLISKVDKEYAEAMVDSKTAFDFMINNSLLSFILALSILCAGLIYPKPSTMAWMWSVPASWLWLLEVAVFVWLAYYFYKKSIGRASAWGALVKGAFDLYRWSLLAQLGYKQPPKTKQAEFQLWRKISQRVIFGKPPTSSDSDYDAAAPTYVGGEPDGIALEIVRGVNAQDADGIVTIILRVRNVDPHGRRARQVVATDTLPKGFEYEWNSASGATDNIEVTGINPYRFSIGDIPPGGQVLIHYRAIPPKDLNRNLSLD
jgi:hypothetical protein